MVRRDAKVDEEPTSFVGLVFDVMQESALNALDSSLDLAQKGALYVAREIVYALGDGDFGEDSTLNSGTKASISRNMNLPKVKKEKTKQKKRSKKEMVTRTKTEESTSKEDVQPMIKLYNSESESRDEVNARPRRVKDLIGKFGGNGTAKSPIRAFGERNNANGRSSSAQLQKEDPPLTLQIQHPQPIMEATFHTHVTHDNNSHEVFRPRSVLENASRDHDRFSYFEATQEGQGLIKQSASLLVPFKDLHRSNQKALFKDESPVVTYNSFQAMTAESDAFVESFLATSSDPRYSLNIAVDPQGRIHKQKQAEIQKQERVSEILDVRAEIEDVHRILAKLQKRQNEQNHEGLGPTQSTDPPAKKDLRQAHDLVVLIGRLQRLSHRYEELKALNAGADTTTATSSTPAVSATMQPGKAATAVRLSPIHEERDSVTHAQIRPHSEMQLRVPAPLMVVEAPLKLVQP